MSLGVKLVGVPQLLHAFRELPRSMRTKHLLMGLNKGGGMLRNSAAQFAAVETGLLKRSLRVKTPSRSAVSSGKDPYAAVGPARNAGRMMRRTAGGRIKGHGKAQKTFLETIKLASGAGAGMREAKRAARSFTGQKHSEATFRNPSRYAHLVEKGTRRMRARPFLSIAVRITGPSAQQAVIQKAQEGLRQEAQKAYARSLTARR
jgi:HK97 gp10 family phage protein